MTFLPCYNAFPMNKPDKSNRSSIPVSSSLALGAQVSGVTLFIVILALVGGLWLDKALDSKPLFTIVLVIGSAPLSLFLTYWMAMRAIREMELDTPTPPSSGRNVNVQDDKDEKEDF